MLIFSLPLLGLGAKSTSLSPGFSVHRPRQYHTICWELNLISGFFGFFWLIVWVDGINKLGWCLAGGRGCWLKGLNQIPSVKLNISSFFTLSHLLDCLICTRNSVSIVLLSWMIGGSHRLGGGWFISGCGWGKRGWVLSHSFCFFLLMLLYFVLSCPVSFFKWVKHDRCCICFFVYYLFSLSLVPLPRSYWGLEIVLSLM